MVESVDSIDLEFLNGYLFRVMVDILHSEAPEDSGLYDYYRGRIEQNGTALSNYDHALTQYVVDHFPCNHRVIVHAGTGIGTLPSALAMSGYRTVAIERDPRRLWAAERVRTALAQAWPEVASRYELIEGEFPSILEGTSWMTPQTVLVFTNCVGGWSEDETARALASFNTCGDILLDALVFGNLRLKAEEQQMLIKRIEALGLTATPIPQTPTGTAFYHFRARPGIS